MSKKKGKDYNEAALQNQVTTATTAAAQPSSFFQRRENLPDGGVGLSLYDNANANDRANHYGTGVNSAEGFNSNYGKQMDAEMSAQRQREASGQLEGYVSNLANQTDNALQGLSVEDQNRRQNNVQNTQQNLGMFYNKPQKPKWWQTLAQTALGEAGLFGLGGVSGLIRGGK
jgi:hypothetical protein